MIILLAIYLLCVALWLGAMVFFSAFVAPIIFTRLTIAQAGTVVSALFPRYYLLGYVVGALGTILAIYFAASRGPRGWWSAAAALLAIALALTVYAGVVVRPKVDAIRSVAEEQNPDPAKKAEFDQLHRRSVTINGFVLVLNLLTVIATAAALAPNG
jgi:hypothetical protein